MHPVRRLMATLLVAVVATPAPTFAAAPATPRPAQPASPQLPCDSSALQEKIDAKIAFVNKGDVQTTARITLTKAETAHSAGGAAYCKVDGKIVTELEKVNDVAFELSLPLTNFNGRYFQTGQGGAGGSIQPPDATMLEQGFAWASTDRGAGASKGLDFSQSTGLCDACAFHLTAVAAQRVTRAFYAAPTLKRYVAGCSAGGADGRGNALAYGASDFDGVVTGDNPFGPGIVLGYARITKYLSDHPDAWISPELLAKAEAKMIERYDAADGARDGVIQDARNFTLDDAVLRDAGLSAPQIAAVHFINSSWRYDSPVVSPTGTYPGHPVARLSQWAMLFGTAPPPWKRAPSPDAAKAPAGFLVTESFMRRIDPNFEIGNYTFDQIAKAYVANNMAASYDYSAFRDGGGKLISYSGIGDGLVPYSEPLVGYQQLDRLEGAASGRAQWARLFLVYAMDHCFGPGGPLDAQKRMLDAVIAWVEQGKAPDALIASRPATPDRPARTFLLCPEPKAAIYGGKGDVNDAANWSCKVRKQKPV